MYHLEKWMLITMSICITAGRADDHGSEGPIISHGNEIILENNQNFTITCKGNRPINFKHQELPEDVVGPFRINQINLNSTTSEYPYVIELQLYNVDQFAVGYYACFDNTINANDLLNSVSEEPQNTEHVSYIYVYVHGSESLIAPLSELIILEDGVSETIIGCRPTSPDINMSLIIPQSNKMADILWFSSKIGYKVRKPGRPGYSCRGVRGIKSHVKYIPIKAYANTGDPQITGGETVQFLEGETFTLNCSIKFPKNGGVSLSWETPPGVTVTSIDSKSNDDVIGSDILYRTITIKDATKDSEGNYTCKASTSNGVPKNKSVLKKYLDKPFLTVAGSLVEHSEKVITSRAFKTFWNIDAYPKTEVFLIKDEHEELSLIYGKVRGLQETGTNTFWLALYNLTVDDTGNYTLSVKNKYITKNITFSLIIKSAPIVSVDPENPVICVINKTTTLTCEAKGYPLPTITWNISDEDKVVKKNEINKQLSIYKRKSWLTISASDTADVYCIASNSAHLNVSVVRNLNISEIEGGFGIMNTETWVAQNQSVRKECIASIYNFTKVNWLSENDTRLSNGKVELLDTKYSHVAILNLERISIDDAKIYKCVGVRYNNTIEDQTISISVEPIRTPVIYESDIEKSHEVFTFQPVEFSCVADGVPQPSIEWFKDNLPLINSSEVKISSQFFNKTTINSTVKIDQVQDENIGRYECLASNEYTSTRKAFHVVLKGQILMRTIIIVTVVLILLLIILVTWLVWKIRKEKQFKRELKAAGLYFFKKGLPPSLNPELMIDEQAELLPYDEKFEFPQEKLTLGKQLGAGAFGVVYKARARGIIDAEESTTVAVKVVKKTADNQCIKALASELKIMVHLGKHINIVNLLGACTKQIGKRELMVIVEYCKFGNLHNYMQKHREVFVDTLTDNKETNLGKVNRGYSCSSANSGTQFEYFGSNHSQETDHTFVNNTGNSRMMRKTSDSGYIADTNYESDSMFEGCKPRPLYSRDLLCWAFQIARGMEYLSTRKVLHGDLAARNILLSDDNIVKICDFGLARSVYKDEEYQKKENCLLPVKWLAIECMTDRIFSTQSDVWAYGIVLWELFSLAKTPYPNISPHNLLEWLCEGKRLEKPMYADDRLYDVMVRCWEHKPTARPSFGELQEIVGTFLEDTVRNHYVDLNAIYVDINKKQVGKEDYIDMVCAPDYNKMVAPSPHHYVNDGVCTIQLQQDDDGYLQMSPAQNQNLLRPPGCNKFDFDVKKLNTSESGHHDSELTPMLTLNNLPTRSGSDSDIENNASPYLNVKSCTRIDEEINDVFDEKQNNVKNIQNGVTNPTYITLDANSDKKSQAVKNDYMNVPNGLVT